MRAMTTVSAALPDDAPHLLVVDDDRRIRALLSRFLFAEGYRVTTAETVADARAKLAGLRFDLLILDVMMPGETGFDLARDLRASSSVPIIMLTARDEAQSRIEGLTLGADDYVSKPFGIGELMARIRTLLRHRSREEGETTLFESGGLSIDTLAHKVTRDGKALKLTPKEYEVLQLLVRNAGRVLTHRQILQAVWGPANVEDTQYLRVFVGRLRQKIEADPSLPQLIVTEPGVGYRFSSGE